MKFAGCDIVPYIRRADYAIRRPFFLGKRNLLDYILFYVQEGTFELVVNGRKHVTSQGELLFLQPGDIHTIQGLDDTINPYVHLDFFYNPHRESSFITLPGQVEMAGYERFMQPRLNDSEEFRVPLMLQVANHKHMVDLVLKMIEAWQEQTLLGQLEAHRLAHEWISSLLKQHIREAPAAALQEKPFMNWITSFLAFHFSEPISVEDMAARAGLSPSRFTVLFKQHFGLPPYQYLQRLRVEHAKELLRAGQPIKLVSEYCGFADVHYFTKAFKAAAGVTPGQYRTSEFDS